MSKLDRVALEIAEGIANIPIEGKKAAGELLKKLEKGAEAPQTKKHVSGKIRAEVKKKGYNYKKRRR